MALKIPFSSSSFSLIPQNPHQSHLQSPPTSSFHFHFKKPFKHLKSSSSPSPPPIFLPHLEQFHSQNDQPEEKPEEIPQIHRPKEEEDIDADADADDDDEEEEEEEEEDDPIRAFFKFRNQLPDPPYEGKTPTQRNRKPTWHIAKTSDAGSAETDTDIPFPDDQEEAEPALTEDNVVSEILKIARNLPENSTLGDFLSSYEGKVREGECVELLGRLGEEGLVRECLYLFEWMRLQEPPLVTPRACSVLFPVLGRAGMGEEVVVLFGNLPRTKEFRDVRVYNSAISGLSCCGR